jgi:hypothetical protein
MSQLYTLAGPDIGVRKVTFAELLAELGDVPAMDAALAVDRGEIYNVPDAEPRRIVRLYKDGDATLGYDYLQRKAEAPPPPARRSQATPQVVVGDDPEAPCEWRDQTGRAVHRVMGTMTITIPMVTWANAKDHQEAEDAVRFAYGAAPLPEGMDVENIRLGLAKPDELLAHAGRTLERNDFNFQAAGWRYEATDTRLASNGELAKKSFDAAVERSLHRILLGE